MIAPMTARVRASMALLLALWSFPAPAAGRPTAPPPTAQTLPRQSPTLPIEVSGATYAELDARTGIWLLRGAPVVITRGGTRLEAAHIFYAERAGVARASGGVIVRHETMTMRAREAEGRLREQVIHARGDVTVSERRPEGTATLTAGRLDAFLGERRLEATERPHLGFRDGTLRGEHIAYRWGTQTATVTGGAEVSLPEGRMRADQITAALAAETADAVGAVRFSSADVVATAPRARVDRGAGIALLTGGVLVQRGPDILSAEQVTIELRSRRVIATGAPRLVIGSVGGP